jgi:hypothetical protein
MQHAKTIIVGLSLFVVLITFPLWFAVVGPKPRPKPQPVRPQTARACVESTAFMRTSHMKLLVDWRDAVVREGRRDYVAHDGKTWEMSLSRTCMGCHQSEANFCGECHSYAGVTLDCWRCHVKPEDVGLAPVQRLSYSDGEVPATGSAALAKACLRQPCTR